jgi:putative oxidoreductase
VKRTTRGGNGGSIAALVLRGALGSTMIAHGLKHGRTLDGTAGWFGSIGFRAPRLQAKLSSAVEVGAGAALILGAATPLSASAVVGTMTVAYETVHKKNGYFITGEGWEYVGLISAASVALSALGPGRWSVDRFLGADEIGRPMLRGLTTAGVGIAGAAGQLAAFWDDPAKSRPESQV